MHAALFDPPIALSAPETGGTVALVVLTVGLVGLYAFGLLRRDWALPLLLLGAAAASLVEASLDELSRIWWASNLERAYTAFERPIPLIVVVGYSFLVGGGTYASYKLVCSGTTRKRMLTLALAFFVVESAFEMVWLRIGFYEYYGRQPLEVFGFPLYWGAINAVGAITAGYVVYLIHERLVGPRVLLLVLIPPLSFGADFAVGWPTWTVMNMDVSTLVMSLVSLITIALCVGEAWLVSGAAERAGSEREPSASPASSTATSSAARRVRATTRLT
jgi:hypothetical protein